MDVLPIAETVRQLAKATGLSEQQVSDVLQAQAELAYRSVTPGYPLPGLGVFFLSERPEAIMVMPFGPKAGKQIKVPGSKKLKFDVANVAKKVVLSRRSKSVPNVLAIELTKAPEPTDPGE